MGLWVKFMTRRQMKKRCSVQMEWLQWFWVVQVTCYRYLSVFCFQGFFFWNKDRCQLCDCFYVCGCVFVFFFSHDSLISKTSLIRSAWFLDQVHTELLYDIPVWPEKNGNIQTYKGEQCVRKNKRRCWNGWRLKKWKERENQSEKDREDTKVE